MAEYKDHYDNLNELKADIMFEALDVLRTLGHSKGSWMDTKGQVCFGGALGMAICNDAHLLANGTSKKLRDGGINIQKAYVAKQLAEEGHKRIKEMSHYGSFMAWNDAGETTEQDVEKVFMQMAEHYEQRYLEGFQS